MKKLIRTLAIENASLRRIAGGRRFPVADFDGRIEIYEEQSTVPLLGHLEKGMKSIHAAFILSSNIRYCTDTETINSAMVFEADATVAREDGTGVVLLFSGLRFIDNEPISGEVAFEITDLYLIKDMLNS